jgi:hypothetical protein
VTSQPLSHHQSSIGKSTQLKAEIPKLEMVAQPEAGEPDALRLDQPDLSTWQIKSELDNAIAKLSSLDRQQLAQKLCREIDQVGLDWSKINLSTQLPEVMSPEDISQLAAYTYQFHAEIFQAVFLEKPQLIHSLSNNLMNAIIGIMATKWIHSHSRQP